MKAPRVKYLRVADGKHLRIDEFPNFSATGSVTGMRKRCYGNEALLVRCGSYIYNVSARPEIYFIWAY